MDQLSFNALIISHIEKKHELHKTPSARASSWGELVDEVLLNVFQYLSVLDLCRAAQVNKAWRNISCDPSLWATHEPRWIGAELYNTVYPQKDSTQSLSAPLQGAVWNPDIRSSQNKFHVFQGHGQMRIVYPNDKGMWIRTSRLAPQGAQKLENVQQIDRKEMPEDSKNYHIIRLNKDYIFHLLTGYDAELSADQYSIAELPCLLKELPLPNKLQVVSKAIDLQVHQSSQPVGETDIIVAVGTPLGIALFTPQPSSQCWKHLTSLTNEDAQKSYAHQVKSFKFVQTENNLFLAVQTNSDLEIWNISTILASKIKKITQPTHTVKNCDEGDLGLHIVKRQGEQYVISVGSDGDFDVCKVSDWKVIARNLIVAPKGKNENFFIRPKDAKSLVNDDTQTWETVALIQHTVEPIFALASRSRLVITTLTKVIAEGKTNEVIGCLRSVNLFGRTFLIGSSTKEDDDDEDDAVQNNQEPKREFMVWDVTQCVQQVLEEAAKAKESKSVTALGNKAPPTTPFVPFQKLTGFFNKIFS